MLLPEFDAFLCERSFDRAETVLTTYGWDDAFYRRTKASTANDQQRGRRRRNPPLRSQRRLIESRARSVVSEAVAARFDAAAAEVENLNHRIAIIEQMLVRNEREIGTVRKQLDDCLVLLRESR